MVRVAGGHSLINADYKYRSHCHKKQITSELLLISYRLSKLFHPFSFLDVGHQSINSSDCKVNFKAMRVWVINYDSSSKRKTFVSRRKFVQSEE